MSERSKSEVPAISAELRNLLERSERMAATGQIAAAAAHEINNVLDAAMNLLYLARTAGPLPEAAEHHIAAAEAELVRMAQIVRQTLGLYRAVEGDGTASVRGVVEPAMELLENRARRRNATLEPRWRSDGGVRIGSGELRQVAVNLLVNALDAVQPGGVVAVRVRAGGGRVSLVVSDNGAGIAAEVQARMFEPLFTTKGESGTGLGLWLSRQIVERAGGTLRVRSATAGGRRGTTFVAAFPALPSKN